ncbi:hypothetical protein GPL19_05870 [Enterocloster bolteae]|nr:OmpH family outer membrane protein [Enterocloster bolteae]MBT9825478.1 hypothetical protein [Enterocloster bolteae]
MAVKKNYDKYNMFASSSNTEEDEKEDNVSVAARIFERRRQALKQDGATSTESGMSPAEIFKKRKEYLKTATQRTPEQTDILRADREEARKLSQKLSVSPNKKLYATPDQQPQNAGSPFAPIRQTPEQKSQIEEYARQLAEKTKQEKQAKQKREQEQQETKRILDKTGFQDGYQFKRYVDVNKEPDFNENVQAGKDKANIFEEYAVYTPLDYFNKDRMAVRNATQANNRYMSENEKNIYYYINGKYGPESAANYIKSLNVELNRRSAEDMEINTASFAQEHPVIGTALDAGTSLGGGVAYPTILAKYGVNSMLGKQEELDPNDPMYTSAIINEGIRTGVTNNETVKKLIPNEGLRNFTIGTGLSMTENLARLPMGHLGLMAAAGGAGLSGTRDAIQRGGGNGQSIALGIANAGAEAFFEKYSLEGWEKLKTYPAKSVKEFLKNMGKQAVIEGSEEGFTEIANTISDQVIMDNLSQYNLEYENYTNMGMDEKTAKEKAFQSFLSNVGLSVAGGALSGGIMGGGGQALGLMQENRALNQYGKSIDQDYRDYSQNIDISPENYTLQDDYREAVNLKKLAEEYAERQRRGEFIKNREKAEYDMRFQEFQNNVSDHNNAKSDDTNAQNEPYRHETVRDEESQEQTYEAEYGPYNEPVVMPVEGETTGKDSYIPETNNINVAEAYRTPYGENGGKALEENYDGSVDISTYNRAFGRVYDAGRYDVDLSVAEHSAIVSVLTPEQVTAAYKAGAQDRNKEMQIDIKTGLPTNMIQGETKTGGLGAVTENASEAQRTVAEHVGKMTGLKINLVDDVGEGNATASYKHGEITLSVNASDFNGALSHELTHFIKDYANDAYNVYTKYAVQALMESDSVSLEDLVEQYETAYSKAGQEASREEIMDDIVADATQKFLNDSQFAESIVKKDRTLAQKIVDFFTDVIDALKSLMKTGSTRKAAKALEEKVTYFEGCRDIWMNAAGEASERYKSGAELVENSQAETMTKRQAPGVSEKTEQGIRYQLEDIDDTTTQRRIDALLYENQALKEANELLEKQFKISPKSAVRQQDVAKVSRNLLKEYNSTYKHEILEKNLDRLYGYIRGAEHVDSAELTEAATSIARSVLKQSKQVDTELTQQYKDLRNQIRNTKINITDQDKADLASAGGYNEFRRRNFGRMKLGNDGISIDSFYQELSAQHPELFSEDVTHPADQLMAIADVLDQTDAQVSNPYHANMDEMAYMVGQDILQSYFDVRQAQPTFADRKAAEVQRVQREYTRKMADYKKSLKQQYISKLEQVRKENGQKIQELSKAYRNLTAAQQREQAEFYREKMDSLRNEKNQALAAMQQRSREQTKMIRESQRAREAKKSIMKETKAMQSWLLKPTDSKHVPEVLRTTVARFLENIDFSSNELNNDGIPTQRSQAWDDAQKAFRKIIENEGVCEDGETFIDIDPDLAVRMEDLVNKTKGIDKLDNLDAYTLEELKKVVVSMKKAITEANSLKSNRKSGQLSILAEGVFRDLGDRRNRQEYAMLVGGADKLLNYDMLDPQTMFGQMGDNVKSTYDSLRDGLNRKTVKLKIAQNYIEDILKENNVSFKDLREWTGKDAKPKRFKTSSGTIELTVSEVMSLYELNKRNQARGHMYDRNGGIKHAPRVSKLHFENGKLIPSRIDKNYSPLKVSEADVELIVNTLTPEQKALADGMQRFMGNECAEWGNEVTMEMYGYQKFTAGNYFPIVTDNNYIQTKQGDMAKKKSTIKNMGITKNTIKNANNPIIIEDIFDVYTRQVDHMSTYNAYVIPLSDLNKVFNYKDTRNEASGSSIKQEIERTYGKAGNAYIDKLLDDINGSIYTEKSIGDKLLSNMKAASVAGNLRVAIQQPTAYVRASMEISPKYLSRGAMTMTRKGQWDLICQYAPIAQWKDWGFYRMDTSRQMKDVMFNTDTMKQRFVNKTMILAEKGDELAWNRLWRACEFECLDKHSELKEGTQEFYTEVGKRFSEIVDKTQVVDSVLHRTQIMRSNHALDRLATNFMAEPLKSYNMLYRAAVDIKLNKKGAKSRAVRAGAVFILNGVCTAAAAAVVDALRDDDRDKDYWDKYRESLKDNMLDSINIINNIPWGKDVVSAVVQGYSPTRADLSGFQDIYYAFSRIDKLKEGDSKYTPQSVAIYSARMASKLLGLPVNSMVRDAEAIVDTAINESGNESADYKWLKQKYAIGSKENLGLYVGMMIETYRNDDNEFQKQIKEDLNAAGIDNDSISQKIKTLIKGELISDKSVDPRVDEAAKAKISMDLKSYEAAINELMEDGYAGKLIGSAITARINQLSGDDEIDWEAEAEVEPDELYGEILTGKAAEEDDWNPYTSGDIITAIEMIDRTPQSLETFNHIASAMVDYKVKAGKKAEDAASTMKSSITRKYKAEWIEAYRTGNRAGYEEIQRKLNYLRVNGKTLYSGKEYSSWREEARKKQ